MKKHILVVDDSKNIRDLLRVALTEKGYQVTTRGDGFEAIRAMASTPFDLVLLDIRLPGGYDGIQTCHLIHQNKKTANIPVIMVTALGDKDVVIQARQAGASDFIIKPFETHVVFEKVERALAAHAPDTGGEAASPTPEDHDG